MQTVRVYKAELMAIEDCRLHYREVESYSNMIDAFDGILGMSKIQSHTYPIQLWQEKLYGVTVETRICLADDLLQKVFLKQEENLKREREAVKWQSKINDRWRHATFWQRLKYLFYKTL